MRARSLLMILIPAASLAVAILFYTHNDLRRDDLNTTRFVGLGDLHGGTFSSVAYGVSADGSTVVGASQTADGVEAFRWTPAERMVALGFAQASAVSADGSTIVGYSNTENLVEPVRWTNLRGAEQLEPDGTIHLGAAADVSAKGTTIVGTFEANGSIANSDAAFRWTSESGPNLLGDGATATKSEAHAVSDDGAVVVGAIQNPNGHDEAFRWTAQTGAVRLGFLPSHTTSTAFAVSADGAVVVGCSSDYSAREAFRWTRETGMISLGSLSLRICDSAAHGVSSDGSVIVGYSTGNAGWEAFIWDEKRGMRSIREVLINDFHLASALSHWKLRAATAVSGDGTTIVGFAHNRHGNTEAWIARLADPLTNP